MKTTSDIDRKGNEAWDTCREHFSFPASIIMASNLQHHAHSSLLKLANVAKRCREGLRDMRHAQRDAVLPDLPKYRATSEWKAVNGRRFSSRAKPRLCLPKTSHLINPKGPGENDRSGIEKSINVITSLPFLAVGAHTLHSRSAKGEEQKIFGWSMVAMGTAATLYHATSGRLRSLLRKVDYYTISLSCMAMERSLHPKSVGLVGRATRVASLAALPFKPTAVTACYAAQMEMTYAKRARNTAAERRQHRHHMAATSAGLGCFALEGAAINHGIPITHPLWHCLACYAMSSVQRPRLPTA